MQADSAPSKAWGLQPRKSRITATKPKPKNNPVKAALRQTKPKHQKQPRESRVTANQAEAKKEKGKHNACYP